MLSEAEIDALEFVVEYGRIAGLLDYGVLRSLLVRVRPEWETADSVSPFVKPETDSPQPVKSTPQTPSTPSEGSVQDDGTVGPAPVECSRSVRGSAAESVVGAGPTNMADIVYEAVENLQNVQKTFDQWSRATASVLYRAARHIEILEDAP